MNKVSHQNVISLLFLVGVILLMACGLMAYTQYQRLSSLNNDLIQSYQTIRAANQSLLSMNEAALLVSLFLQTKDTESLKKIPQIITAAQINFDTLAQLVSDNQLQTTLINQLKPLLADKIKFLTLVVNEYNTGNMQQALEISADKSRLKLTNTITQSIIEIKQEEIRQLNESTERLKVYKMKAQFIITLLAILNGFFFIFSFIALDKYFKKY